jgi:hypothetical protein
LSYRRRASRRNTPKRLWLKYALKTCNMRLLFFRSFLLVATSDAKRLQPMPPLLQSRNSLFLRAHPSSSHAASVLFIAAAEYSSHDQRVLAVECSATSFSIMFNVVLSVTAGQRLWRLLCKFMTTGHCYLFHGPATQNNACIFLFAHRSAALCQERFF